MKASRKISPEYFSPIKQVNTVRNLIGILENTERIRISNEQLQIAQQWFQLRAFWSEIDDFLEEKGINSSGIVPSRKNVYFKDSSFADICFYVLMRQHQSGYSTTHEIANVFNNKLENISKNPLSSKRQDKHLKKHRNSRVGDLINEGAKKASDSVRWKIRALVDVALLYQKQVGKEIRYTASPLLIEFLESISSFSKEL